MLVSNMVFILYKNLYGLKLRLKKWHYDLKTKVRKKYKELITKKRRASRAQQVKQILELQKLQE